MKTLTSMIAIAVAAGYYLLTSYTLGINTQALIILGMAAVIGLCVYAMLSPLCDAELQAISSEVMGDTEPRAVLTADGEYEYGFDECYGEFDLLPEPPAEITLPGFFWMPGVDDREEALAAYHVRTAAQVAQACDGDNPTHTTLTVAEAYALHARHLGAGVLSTI